MSSKYINNFIFLNPTPNLVKVASMVKALGGRVQFSYTDIYHPVFFDKCFLLKNGTVKEVESGNEINVQKISACYYFKKDFFKKLKFRKVNRSLEFKNFLPYMGQFKKIKPVLKEEMTEYGELKKTLEVNGPVRVVFSYLSSNFSDVLNFSGMERYIFKIEGDHDFSSIFKEGIYFYNVDKDFSLYKVDDTLFINSSDRAFTPKDIYKYSESFKLKLELVGKVQLKKTPWVEKIEKGNFEYIFVNDYGLMNISVKMWDDWYENIARVLCSEKRQ